MNNNENNPSPLVLNFDDPDIVYPQRTRAVVAAAAAINYPMSKLSGLVLDALDADDTRYIDVMPDVEGADLDAFMIHLIRALAGSDDDFDYLSHDIDHALADTEACIVHEAPCAACCDECAND